MSAPFAGAPATPVPPPDPVHGALAALPRPRKHYQWYYSTREADGDMLHCAQGVHAFLRAYYHMKSADWADNKPYELASWSAPELAKMPTYYIMDLGQDMAQTVAPHMPTGSCAWLTDDELRVYSEAFERTGFQAALQWYRCRTTSRFNDDLSAHHGEKIQVRACFIGGKSDWGPYQRPGDLRRMRESALADDRGCHFVEGAGHWVQQEQPAKVVALLRTFLAEVHDRQA